MASKLLGRPPHTGDPISDLSTGANFVDRAWRSGIMRKALIVTLCLANLAGCDDGYLDGVGG